MINLMHSLHFIFSIIRILLSYGANVNTANKLGRTALMLASNKGYIDIVDILIKKGANINANVSNVLLISTCHYFRLGVYPNSPATFLSKIPRNVMRYLE